MVDEGFVTVGLIMGSRIYMDALLSREVRNKANQDSRLRPACATHCSPAPPNCVICMPMPTDEGCQSQQEVTQRRAVLWNDVTMSHNSARVVIIVVRE